ncbi:hydroxyethylthiazole kinase [Acidaminobacter sp. JC074]|uniref:hydroxyethylthiazole kinase n=1 Tax=Acidaminobacter sp. JC074 TaxID=2530199 RepID=UPI001F0FD0D2|nr:hydroxyethylthiazole kinase [Acidaminobacter sp. JC074]MCH4888643.1 hydroxyethylthiazole kinase [Acidaminobacter sp. JC074]
MNLSALLKNVKTAPPLVHNITNYVTVNDCANILLAIGAAPIMADAIEEVDEITSICSGLNINIGTLNARTIESMIQAGKTSNTLNHPVVLDPVGAGASKLRTQTAKTLLDQVNFSVIRGNISEIKTLAMGSTTTQGVDANAIDTVTEDNLNETIEFLKAFSEKNNAIIAITGAIDIVASKDQAIVIRNGHPEMSRVTGTGCMLSALITAFVSANPDNHIQATAAAIMSMGLAGEQAYETLVKNNAGSSSYRNYIIDEIYKLNEESLNKGAKYEIR